MRQRSGIRIVMLGALLAHAGCARHDSAAFAPPGMTLSGAPAAQAQGNGSSGVGNYVSVVPGIDAQLARAGAVKVENGVVSDTRTGEKLLSVEPISPDSLTEAGAELVPSRLGSVPGFEYLPGHRSGEGVPSLNRWVVCPKPAECYKLTPLSATNALVPSIIGSLRAKNGGGR